MAVSSTKGFFSLDWKIVKAMIWTETGAHDPAWHSRPMQIGNEGDSGLDALLAKDQGGEIILPMLYRIMLNKDNVRTRPLFNIEAGVGYLLLRMANYGFANFEDQRDSVHDYTVSSGDTLEGIAIAHKSTVKELQKLNPHAGMLSIGQKLKIRRAEIRKVITGFIAITPDNIAKYYNTRDERYADKLRNCLKYIK